MSCSDDFGTKHTDSNGGQTMGLVGNSHRSLGLVYDMSLAAEQRVVCEGKLQLIGWLHSSTACWRQSIIVGRVMYGLIGHDIGIGEKTRNKTVSVLVRGLASKMRRKIANSVPSRRVMAWAPNVCATQIIWTLVHIHSQSSIGTSSSSVV